MKVLMPVLHYYPVIGGLETWTQNIAEGLSNKVEVFVVTGRVKDSLQKENVKGITIMRTSLFSLKDLSYSSLLYIFSTLPFVFLKSLSLTKKERIDLFHCQGFLSSFLGYLLSKAIKVPYVVTIQRLEQDKGFFKKIVYKNAKVCIAASSAIKSYFQEIGVKNIEIIPNGVDLGRFENIDRKENREKLNLRDEFLIMTIARLERVKGIEYLIKSVLILNTKYKIQDTKFIIIGDGSEKKRLESLVKRLGLEEKVIFLGQIQNDNIPQYLAASDCFCLPSLREGFGIAVLEAQASGIPVVASNVGGIADIVEDGKTGILFTPGEPEAIAEAIFKVYSNSEFREELVKNALVKVKEYNWNNIVSRVQNLYQKVID